MTSSSVSIDEQDRDQGATLHLAYAEASIMLLECVMLTLIERKLVPMDAMIDAVEAVIETKRELVGEGVHPEIGRIAVAVLSRLVNSVAAAGVPAVASRY